MFGNAGPVQRRDMDENVLPAAITHDEAEPLIGIVPLHRANLFDSRLIGGLIGPFRTWASRLLLQRRARIDTQYFGDLRSLLTWCRPDFQPGARRHRAVAAALDDAHVEKGVTACGKLDEAEALFWIIPLYRGRNRRPGRRRLEARAALPLRISQIRRRQVVVVIKAAPLRSPGLSIFAHVCLGGAVKRFSGQHSSQSRSSEKSFFRKTCDRYALCDRRPGKQVRLRIREASDRGSVATGKDGEING